MKKYKDYYEQLHGNKMSLEGYGNQYWPIRFSILAWRAPSLIEKPGRPQSIGLQEVGHYRSDPACIDARHFFACGSSSPARVEREGSAAACLRGPWWHQVCGDMDCLCCRSYGPIRVIFRASCSWRSEGLFGQSFSIAPPIQALRGFRCLGSFSVVWQVRHIEGPPYWGPTL